MSQEQASRTYDSLHMGRSSIDLYSNDVGATFPEITSFAAYVGGSPTNISVGGRRLGMKTAIVTGVGVDPVGDFILEFLDKEGVDTQFTVRKPEHRSSAVVLGIEPLVYRTRLLGLDDKRLRLHHAMHHGESDELLFTAEQMLLHVDTRGGRTAAILPGPKAALDAIWQVHREQLAPDGAGRAIAMKS